MPYAIKRAWHRLIVPMLAMIVASWASPAHAHVNWNRTNSVDSDTAALYHFDNATTSLAPAATPLPEDLGLTVFSGSAALSPVPDTPAALFNPLALSLPATQTLRSTDTLHSITQQARP